MSEGADARSPFARYRALMDAHGFRPSRRLGQNFLLEPALHAALADAAGIGPNDLVLEVGPGLGFLTRELCARARAVIAVEVDARLAAILAGELREMPHGDRVRLVTSDVLGRGGVLAAAVVQALEAERGGRFVVAANLPYAVTGPFLAAVVQAEAGAPDSMALLVQLELAERITARPGTAAYGGPGALLQAGYDVELVRRVGREVFRPRPNVDSAIVRAAARPDAPLHRLAAVDRARFARFVRILFGARRKMLRHGLERAGRELGIRWAEQPDRVERRAEELSGEELLALFLAAESTRQD